MCSYLQNLWPLHWECNPPNTPNTRKQIRVDSRVLAVKNLSGNSPCSRRRTPELSDHGQRQDGLAFRTAFHRCPWFAPVIWFAFFMCHSHRCPTVRRTPCSCPVATRQPTRRLRLPEAEESTRTMSRTSRP